MISFKYFVTVNKITYKNPKVKCTSNILNMSSWKMTIFTKSLETPDNTMYSL